MIEAIAYVKYFDEDDSIFDLNKDYYKNNDDYFSKLSKECNVDIMGNNVKMCSAIDDNEIQKSDSFGSDSYAECPIQIDCDIDRFFDLWAKGQPSTISFIFDVDNADDEFFEWIGAWNESSRKYNEFEKNVADKSIKTELNYSFGGVVDFFISLKNKADETKYFKLNNCFILNKKNLCCYDLYIGNIELVDNLE